MANPFFSINQRFSLEMSPPANMPIFILSSIWRSGSTALQRTLCTDKDILVWGEPYSDCNLFGSLSRSAMALTQSHWPTLGHFPQDAIIYDQPEKFFIANLYPHISHMQKAHRTMLDTLFCYPAKEKGRERFGMKFVRLGKEECEYLEWIYPDAKFIVLIRNPWDAWKSYKGNNWMYRWPKGVVQTADQFAKLWLKQTEELLAFTPTIENNILKIRYEDYLKPNFDWDNLRAFCALLNISPEQSLEHKITGVQVAPNPVTEEDNQTIATICGKLANPLGYLGPQNTI